jgi:hypothetical protein
VSKTCLSYPAPSVQPFQEHLTRYKSLTPSIISNVSKSAPVPTGTKRKRADSSPVPQERPSNRNSSSPLSTIKASPQPGTPKKSLSLSDYKKRKINSATNDPLTPTLQSDRPSYSTDSPRPTDKSKKSQSRDENLQVKLFADKSKQYHNSKFIAHERLLAKGTSLKRETDKLLQSDEKNATVSACVTATHAILYFLSAFACDDHSRELQGKLPIHENWKSTSDYISSIIKLQKDSKEIELEGLWYFCNCFEN